jgi:hypothetical protein
VFNPNTEHEEDRMKCLRKAWGISLCFAVLGATVAISGCSSGAERGSEAATGTVSMQLTGQTNGNSYRLRNARFEVLGPTMAVLDSESDLTVTTLNTTLPSGAYTITLVPGWSLERNDGGTFNVVQATLSSMNPESFQILGGGTTNVAFQFSTDGTLVTIGTGQLSVSIGVTETSGMGSTCTVGVAGGCPTPQTCYFVVNPDGASGTGQCLSQGMIPIGSACTGSASNECANGGICASDGSMSSGGVCFQTCSPMGVPCPTGQSCLGTGVPDLNVCQ